LHLTQVQVSILLYKNETLRSPLHLFRASAQSDIIKHGGTIAYNEALAERMRVQLKSNRGVVEKKMFGGIGFMVNGNPSTGSGQAWPAAFTSRI
jgi:hypothetical protein